MRTVMWAMVVVVMCWAGCAWGETVRVSVVVKDEARKKDIEVTVVYPKVGAVEVEGERGGGKWPLVVVSHGAGGTGAGGTGGETAGGMGAWMERIAAEGFVVVAPTHEDGAVVKQGPLLKGGGVLWEGRARDVSAVAGAAWEKLVPELAGRVATEKVGVVGEALGAYTAMLVGGVRPEWEKKEKDFRDERVRAVVLLSAPGVGQQGLTEKSFGQLGAAAMVVRAEDKDAKGQKEGVYQLSPEGGKFLLTLKGSRVGMAWGRGGATKGARPMEAFTAVVVAFLRAELKGDMQAKDELVAGSVMAGFRDVGTLEGR